MNLSRRRILFFTPYATRTGSEMLIYYILKYLDRSKFEAGVVCFARGELLKDFPPDIPVFIAPKNFTLTQKVAFHLGFNPITHFLNNISKLFKADIWYVNTVMLPEVIHAASRLKIPVITHVQELSSMYLQVSRDDFEALINKSELLIGCSETVRNCLLESGGKRVERLYNFVDINEIIPVTEKVKQIRREWGVEQGDFVWVMSGSAIERKGFDLLPDIALQFPTGAKVHLVWVGKLVNDGLVYWTEQRCRNIKNVKIHLVGAKKEDYYSYLDAADGFMLTSRQEPFGMVLVEAAWLGKPIVSFKNGGPDEFIKPEIGTLVPHLNIPLYVQSMLNWQYNGHSYNKEKAKERALEFNAEKGVLEWQEIINRF